MNLDLSFEESPFDAQMLLLAVGGATLGAWRVGARALPAVDAAAGGSLAQRAADARRRGGERAADARRTRHDEPLQLPDEAALRALCTPPEAELQLPARLLGMEPAPILGKG